MNYQPGIIDGVPALARYQFFRLKAGANPKAALLALADMAVENDIVVGLGHALITCLGAKIDNMHRMPEFDGVGIETPATPFALMCWIRGDDHGEILHKARATRSLLKESFELDHIKESFRYDSMSRDLTGYEDGTENPEDDEALDAAICSSDNPALNGSSYVAVQEWVHNLDDFEAMTPQQQDHTFGRSRVENEELDDAPESAHVKRAEQEHFEPEAFMLRRSMPWSNEIEEGLMFVAFGKNFDAFEAVLNRMVGAEDGIVDALFSFTRPVTGCYFWCPPVQDGKLNLAALG